MLKASELRNQSEKELMNLEEDLKREIFELTSELRVSRSLDKPHLLKTKKRERSRILTILHEKKRNQSS